MLASVCKVGILYCFLFKLHTILICFSCSLKSNSDINIQHNTQETFFSHTIPQTLQVDTNSGEIVRYSPSDYCIHHYVNRSAGIFRSSITLRTRTCSQRREVRALRSGRAAPPDQYKASSFSDGGITRITTVLHKS